MPRSPVSLENTRDAVAQHGFGLRRFVDWRAGREPPEVASVVIVSKSLDQGSRTELGALARDFKDARKQRRAGLLDAFERGCRADVRRGCRIVDSKRQGFADQCRAPAGRRRATRVRAAGGATLGRRKSEQLGESVR